MVKTLEELRREKQKLLNQKAVREDFRKADIERRMLQREISDLKRPGWSRFKKVASGIGRRLVEQPARPRRRVTRARVSSVRRYAPRPRQQKLPPLILSI